MRQPEFVTEEVFKWAIEEEPVTIEKMNSFSKENGLESGIGDKNNDGMMRLHHEIYLSDPRKIAPEKRKTIIRHPIK